MSFYNWLQNLRSALVPAREHRVPARRGARRAAPSRLTLESLEDRRVFAFGSPVDYNTGAAGLVAVVAADFNNDGNLDLATANAGSNNVSVLLGSANGTFGPAITSPAGGHVKSIAVGDFDNDGNLDLAAVNDYQAVLSLMFGKGDGSFEAPRVSPDDPSSDLLSVAVGDFNDDGTMDLAVTSARYYSFYYETIEATVLISNGDRTFSAQESAYLEFENRTLTTVVTDFDGDDDLDLLVGVPGDFVRVLAGDGAGHLVLAGDQNWLIGDFYDPGSLVSMAVGDLDHDGVLDLVAQDRADVRVRLGNGQGGFEAPPGGLSYTAGDRPISIALGDYNRDGVLDVATANRDSNNVSFLRGYGDGTFAPPEQSAAGVGAISIAAGDFNGDGWLDIATTNAIGNNVSVLLNNQSWGAPPPLVSVNDAMVVEGNIGTLNATFTLILSRAAGVDVTVRFDTANITAVAGSDYNAATGTVTIPAGELSRTFTVAVRGDRLGEPTETFAVNLSAATNATIGDGQGIGTILDNEPRISISDVTKSEGRRNRTTLFTFTVTLSAAYDQPVTMSYRTVNGTATTSNSDYVAKTGTLTFAPGQTTKTITIEVKGDSKREASETFYLDLFGNSSNSSFTKNRGVGTILNDD